MVSVATYKPSAKRKNNGWSIKQKKEKLQTTATQMKEEEKRNNDTPSLQNKLGC